MFNLTPRLFGYLRRNTRFIFSSIFWQGGYYSWFLLVPSPFYRLFNKKNCDVLIGLASKITNGFKVISVSNNWQVEMVGLVIHLDYLTNDLLEIGYPLVENPNHKMLACLRNPVIFEGPYLTNSCRLSKGDYVLDLGANLGLFSLFASKEIGSFGRVFAFEPNMAASSFLLKNLKNNNIDNVNILNYAVGDQNQEVYFNVDQKDTFGSSFIDNERLDKDKLQKIWQVSIDNFVLENNIQRVDFIKADIEGAERLMLKGAEQTIKRFKPTIAIRIYYLPDDPEVIEAMLKEFVPEYKIEKFGRKTLYAYIPK